MQHVLESTPVLKRRLPVELLKDSLKQPATLTHTQRMRHIIQILGYEDQVVRRVLSVSGERKIRDGKPQMERGQEISKSRFSNWLAEKPPMELWRQGALIAWLEWLAIEKNYLYVKANLPDDDIRVRSLNLAIDELGKFSADDELYTQIWLFREGIVRRLLIDWKRTNSEVDRLMLARYSTFYCDMAEREGRDPSVAPPSARELNEVPTPA